MDFLLNLDPSSIACYLIKFIFLLMMIPIVIMLFQTILKVFTGGFGKDFLLFIFWFLGEIFMAIDRIMDWIPEIGIGETLQGISGCQIFAEILMLLGIAFKVLTIVLLFLKIIDRIFVKGENFHWVFASYVVIGLIIAYSVESFEKYIHNKYNVVAELRPLFECLCG